jgi:hypothetical protein
MIDHTIGKLVPPILTATAIHHPRKPHSKQSANKNPTQSNGKGAVSNRRSRFVGSCFPHANTAPDCVKCNTTVIPDGVPVETRKFVI